MLLGDVGVCAAAVVGDGPAVGMNHPDAPDNARFCLNTVRWLSGALGE